MRKLELLGGSISAFGAGFVSIVTGVDALSRCIMAINPPKPSVFAKDKEPEKPNYVKAAGYGVAATTLGGLGITCVVLGSEMLKKSLNN